MSTLTINLNHRLKNEARKKAKEDGMTLTAVITQFLQKYLCDECRIYMSIAAEKRMDDAIKELDEAIANGTAKSYSSVEEMTEDILNEPDEPEESNGIRSKDYETI
jgi:antitoxin component of RelBE/YafQ-DinJ toxin-antitoxin module